MKLSRLTLAQRIAAVGCLVLITAVAVPIYFINRGFVKDIDFAARERHGIQYQSPLEEVLESLTQHELLTRLVLGGQIAMQAQLAESGARVDAAFERLRAVDARLGETLEFTAEGLAKRQRSHCRFDTVHGEWQALKSGLSGKSAADSDQLHAHLVSDIRTMLDHAGDTSNLSLDSDLDSYYLMDALVATLPQAQERLTGIAAIGQDLAAAGRLDDQHRNNLVAAMAMLKEADLDHVVEDARKSINEDANFHGVSATLEANLPPAVSAYQQANQDLLQLMQRNVADPDHPAAAAEWEGTTSKARNASFHLWRAGARELDVLLDKRIGDIQVTRLWALGLTLLAVALSSLVAAAVVRSATRSLRSASERIETQSAGIAAAANQIASAAEELARGASDQAATLEDISASTEEINAMAKRNSDGSHAAADLVNKSEARFGEVNRSLDGMEAAIGRISAESEKISRIIKVIDEIAFQTNLLALNAAVEAARAGEAGMGFAVVADEVRNLAQRCAQAANDTSTLIEESIASSADGKARVEEVAVAVRAVTEEALRVKRLVDEVNTGSQEQTHGIEQVAAAIASMGQVTQRNAANAEESASSVAGLNSQSGALKEIVLELAAIAGRSRLRPVRP